MTDQLANVWGLTLMLRFSGCHKSKGENHVVWSRVAHIFKKKFCPTISIAEVRKIKTVQINNLYVFLTCNLLKNNYCYTDSCYYWLSRDRNSMMLLLHQTSKGGGQDEQFGQTKGLTQTPQFTFYLPYKSQQWCLLTMTTIFPKPQSSTFSSLNKQL